ncbi:hypothetical protein BDR03DRAFT_970889 [Suillus americanus]|nr:hypothetical protein BDR03DRAFT_970889 [Suillus americanus]
MTTDIIMVFSALTFAQEVELIWRQRWSLMTFLYLSVRYAGIGYVVMVMLAYRECSNYFDDRCRLPCHI